MSGTEAFPILPVGGNTMSQMDFSAWPWQPSLKFIRSGSFWRLGETDASTPSCAVSLHHRFKPQSLWDFKPLWRLSALQRDLHSPFITPFLGIHKQTRSTAQSTQSSALPQPFAGDKRLSTSCPRQKAECGQAATAEAGRLSCMRDAETQEREGQADRVTQKRWQTRTGSRPSRLMKDQQSTPQHLSKCTEYHETILTTEGIQCLHTTPLLSKQTPDQAGRPLKKDQAWGIWNTLLELKSGNLTQYLWNTTLCNSLQLGRTTRN